MNTSSTTSYPDNKKSEIYHSLAKKAVLGSGIICIVGICAFACLFLLMQLI